MIASVVNLNLEVYHFVACKIAVLCRALNALVDCGDIFLGNGAADGKVFEYISAAGFAGNEVNLAVTVLTLTTRLTLVHALCIASLTEGFPVGNLRSAYVCLYLELAEESVDDDVEVKFAHTCDNGLTCFLIGIGLEGRVFFGELDERHGHLFLTGLGLRLDGELDNGVGEGHLLQNDGMIFVAQRIARSRILKTDDCTDIARINFGDFHTGICVHLHETAHSLLLALCGVIHIGTCGKSAGICSEICKTAYEGVGCNLECKTCEGFFVGGLSLFLFARFGVDALYVVYVDGGRKEIDDCIEEHLNALVLVGRTAENGGCLHGNRCLTKTLTDFVGGKFHRVEELHHKLVVAFGCSFHDCHVAGLCSFLHVLGNFCLVVLLAVVGVIDFCVHLDEVDDSAEGVFLTDGKFDGNGVGIEPFLHHLYGSFEVCTVDVHLVDVCDTGNLVLVSLAPYGFGLRLNAALCTECCNRTVENAERTLNFYGEVNVARGIDDVYAAFVLLGLARPCPVTGGCSRSDGDASLLLLNHPVHGGGTVVRFAYLMVDTGIVKDTLGSRRLAGIDVRHYTDISCMQ